MSDNNVKIAIIGGGVGGMSCAVYAKRANADVTIFEQYVMGGLTATIDWIENYPSYSKIEGWQLAENMYKHVDSLGVEIKYEQVVSVKKQEDNTFVITTDKGSYTYNSVVVATGTKHNKLGIEDNYVGRGVSYCATCDGSFYRGQAVAVAGNTAIAVKEALYLDGVVGKVYVLNPTDAFAADDTLVQRLESSANVEILYNKTISALSGEDKLHALSLVDNVTHDKSQLDVEALFVAVGSKPATDFLSGTGVVTSNGFLVTDDTMMTNIEGLFAVGDVANGKLKQIVTACADGAKAGNFAVSYCKALQHKLKKSATKSTDK